MPVALTLEDHFDKSPEERHRQAGQVGLPRKPEVGSEGVFEVVQGPLARGCPATEGDDSRVHTPGQAHSTGRDA